MLLKTIEPRNSLGYLRKSEDLYTGFILYGLDTGIVILIEKQKYLARAECRAKSLNYTWT